MYRRQSFDSEFWHDLIDQLGEGVIILDPRRDKVVYANDEAATVLGYQRRDVLGLDRDDFAYLIARDRLDGERFARAMLRGGGEGECYNVICADQHLTIRLLSTTEDDISYSVMLLERMNRWRADLITEAVLGEDLHSSLVFASSYNETLLQRIEEGEAHPFELQNLTRIVQDSLTHALSQWKWMQELHEMDGEWETGPASLYGVVDNAYNAMTKNGPTCRIDFPDDLPPVDVSVPHLHMGLHALFDALAVSFSPDDDLSITAREQYGTIQMTFDLGRKSLQGDMFDELPGAVAEQTVIQHGGRLWIEKENITSLHISLPRYQV